MLCLLKVVDTGLFVKTHTTVYHKEYILLCGNRQTSNNAEALAICLKWKGNRSIGVANIDQYLKQWPSHRQSQRGGLLLITLC